MVFSSVIFLCYFFPVVLGVYFIIPNKLKNYWLLIASVFFYAWGAPKFIGVVLTVLVIDYYLGNRIYTTEGKAKKIYLLLSIVLNIGMLFYFKYFNFFIENINSLLGEFGASPITWTKIVLPIGISFFVFQEISYTVDIFRGEHKPLKKFSDYMLFIFLFSHLIAGPIVTYNVLADDIVDRRKKLNSDYILTGFFRFSIGLARKVLIANTLGLVADQIFKTPVDQLTSADCWLGAIAYTFQLYFDFSGYSDMAIGIGKMLGFDFPENFNSPYVSQSITEFWKRWHITLGNWMRRYLYIPLGGNRASAGRVYLNLWIVFLLSGLWHGASWTFVIWGAYHGFFIASERFLHDRISFSLPRIIKIPLTFLIVLVGWVFFRADTITYSLDMLKQMFSFGNMTISISLLNGFTYMLIVAGFFSFINAIRPINAITLGMFSVEGNIIKVSLRFVLTILLFAICLGVVVTSGFNPFIYFKF
ncbi:MAG TPA: MBOAT family O-acyltransferase [Chitinophagales bacterium]|nr:MBOAT family O-acyltransferase [Chitinophagales bacterium]